MAEDDQENSQAIQRDKPCRFGVVWHQFLDWCAQNAIHNWLTGIAILVGLVSAIVAIYAAHEGQLDDTLKCWKYCLWTALAPLFQFLGWLLGFQSKKLYEAACNQRDDYRERLHRVEFMEKNMDSIFGVWLEYILNEMKLGGESRASFYVLDDKGCAGREFLFVARVSQDALLERLVRTRFPGDQGVIAEAWKSDSGMASYFASQNVKTDADVVSEMVAKYGFSQAEAESLSMKSRVIIGHVLKNERRKVGIVVIESLHGVKARARKQHEKMCADIVKKVSPHLIRLFEMYSDSQFKQEEPEEEA